MKRIASSLKNFQQYVPRLTADQKKVLRANPALANKIVNDSINKNRSFRCTVCSKIILDFHGYFPRVTCSPACMAEGKKSQLGKKRPEHSARMKIKIRELIEQGKFWTAEHRANNKKHMKRLNSEILTKDRRSADRKSPESKRRQLYRLLSDCESPLVRSKYWSGSSMASLKPEAAYELPISKVRKLMSEYNSIKSSFAMDNNPSMGATQFYKRTTIKGLKYNKKRKSVLVRSSLEYDFVLWLEANKVPWVYEWSKLRYSMDDVLRTYTPDFKIWLGDDIWVVETKGFYTEKSLSKEKKKMVACAAKCRDRGYHMTILSTKRIGKRGASVAPSTWTDIATLTDRQLFAFMRKQIPGGTC